MARKRKAPTTLYLAARLLLHFGQPSGLPYRWMPMQVAWTKCADQPMFHKNTSPPYSCSAAGSCGSGGTVSSSDKSRPHNEKFFGWPRKTPDCGREGYLARMRTYLTSGVHSLVWQCNTDQCIGTKSLFITRVVRGHRGMKFRWGILSPPVDPQKKISSQQVFFL